MFLFSLKFLANRDKLGANEGIDSYGIMLAFNRTNHTNHNQIHIMKYTFINYKNEIIYTGETDNPEETMRFMIRCGFKVGGFQIASRSEGEVSEV